MSTAAAIVLHSISTLLLPISIYKIIRIKQQGLTDTDVYRFLMLSYSGALGFHLSVLTSLLVTILWWQDRVSVWTANNDSLPLNILIYLSTNIGILGAIGYYLLACSKLASINAHHWWRSFLQFATRPRVLYTFEIVANTAILGSFVYILAFHGQEYPRNYNWVRAISNGVRLMYLLVALPLALELGMVISEVRRMKRADQKELLKTTFILFITVIAGFILLGTSFLNQLVVTIKNPETLTDVNRPDDPEQAKMFKYEGFPAGNVAYGLIGIVLSLNYLIRPRDRGGVKDGRNTSISVPTIAQTVRKQ